MIEDNNGVAYTAEALIGIHGIKARQKVVDEIVVAIRNHDIETAKLWDEIGRAVDSRLAVQRAGGS